MRLPHTFRVAQSEIRFYADANLKYLQRVMPGRRLILITDQHVYESHQPLFSKFDTIVLRSGEAYKIQATIDSLVERLIKLEADRKTVLVGVGGGVITDLVGYLAGIYMRGLDFGLVPSTLLSMVDASIGGKNGIDVGSFKNLVGTIRQPNFLLHDYRLLQTLPDREWSNGFAEIIKHAAIGDAKMFDELMRMRIGDYRKKSTKLKALVLRNVHYKFKVVGKDPNELGDRKLLNFGHTLGHGLEIQYELSHGEAISLGMMFAARLSAHFLKFDKEADLKTVLDRYELPTAATFSVSKVLRSMRLDKKRNQDSIDFVLLARIGKAMRKPISLTLLEQLLRKHV